MSCISHVFRSFSISALGLLLVSCGGGSQSADTSAPLVTVVSPAADSIIKNNPLLVSGTISDTRASVTVNGVAAAVEGDTFSASVGLREGHNTIQVAVKAADGRESTSRLNVVLNTTEICGDGSTFTIPLPGLRLPADPSTEQLPNRTLPDDSVTLPDGCDMYAIIVHGYGRNDKFDELMYYKLARFVAQHNGYVHWSWWNNFLGEYMSRALHDPDPILGAANPGNVILDSLAFVLDDGEGKAVPDEDFQFQADADRVLAAIRQRNPDAVIIVAGHSMGGNAVARLGQNTTVDIDLLAPIDPVGNRNLPVGVGGALQYQTGLRNATPGKDNFTPGNQTFNWNRWRAIRTFRGFKQRDCERNAIGLCKDFDPRLFRVEYRCTTFPRDPNSWLSSPPLLFSRSPIICPRRRSDGPIFDPGTLTTFRSNIKRLYHRWQLETFFPYDWDSNYHFGHPGRFSATDILAPNFQAPVPENVGTERDRDKTCINTDVLDPRDARSFGGNALNCEKWDGHGEIIGMRAVTGISLPINRNLQPLALTANPHDWPFSHWFFKSQADERREALIQMASADPWPHEPDDPDLDLVVDDMVTIAQNILDCGDPSNTADSGPSSIATPDVEPNSFGWNNTDVVVTISAAGDSCGAGSPVAEIVFEMTGAETGSGVVEGDSVELLLSAEGTTTITYFARDDSGREEEPNTLVVMIDKTPPTITATTDPEPNQYGWNNTDVTVTFTADDELSGIDTVTDPVTVTEEGADQEIIGVATDRAGNSSTIGVIVNIDKTPPLISGLPEACSLWPPNHKLEQVADVAVSDSLSGIDASFVDAVSSEPESGPGFGNAVPDVVITDGVVEVRVERYSPEGRVYELSVIATDRAGNVAEGNAACIVVHDQRN